MVDFHNPVVIEKDFCAYTSWHSSTVSMVYPLNTSLAVAVVKLWHVLDGIFIWEFFVTLDYEWSIIRGHRPYRWTIWIYSLTRVCALMAVVLNMVGFDSSTPINCQLWAVFELIFAYLAFVGASLLIVIRIIAIWNRNKIAVAIAICAWSTNIAFFIHSKSHPFPKHLFKGL
ncbi:hypothetical protein EI94DRAFT_997547 [Lactarius quietus]|nr:hypothetical protein EI94DRAFT_997547 [Lactarius quietus]